MKPGLDVEYTFHVQLEVDTSVEELDRGIELYASQDQQRIIAETALPLLP